LTQLGVGCLGVFLGAGLTIGAEVYVALQATAKAKEIYDAELAKGPSQVEYDRMCASGAWKRDESLKRICDRMRAELEAWNKADRNASNQRKRTSK
jgi:hypothetical protein